MKTAPKIQILILLALVILPGSARAQSTAFTYNGRLILNGVPVGGPYEMRFALYDAVTGGAVVGSPLTNSTVNVTNGLFSTRIDFGAGIFTGPPRWLEIAVRPGGAGAQTVLTPRQEVTSSPYAVRAQTAGSVAAGTVVANQLNTGGVAPTPGQFLSYDGGNLFWSDSGAAAASIWLTNGNSAYYNSGNVGIGTSTPTHRLSLSGGPSWTANGWIGSMELPNGSALAWQANAAGQRFGMGHANTGFYLFRTASNPGTTGSAALYDFVVNDEGNVGLGINAPATGYRLDVNGSTLLRAANGSTQFGAPNGEMGMSLTPNAGNRADLRFDGSVLKLVASTGVVPPSAANGLAITTAGNVGIGTTAPIAKLHVVQSAAGPALHAEGNATQARDKGGFVKAMAYIDPYLPDGQRVVRCYNSQRAGNLASTAPCGITVEKLGPGRYIINFGFDVRDRFISVTPSNTPVFVSAVVGNTVEDANLAAVIVTNIKDEDRDVEFNIFVF